LDVIVASLAAIDDQQNRWPRYKIMAIRVGLNAMTNDFWARDLASWNIQEGFFVEAAPSQITSVAVTIGSVVITCTTQPGPNYWLEQSENLSNFVESIANLARHW
jgi:hypothetical protein